MYLHLQTHKKVTNKTHTVKNQQQESITFSRKRERDETKLLNKRYSQKTHSFTNQNLRQQQKKKKTRADYFHLETVDETIRL